MAVEFVTVINPATGLKGQVAATYQPLVDGDMRIAPSQAALAKAQIPPLITTRTDLDAYAATQGLTDDEVKAFTTKDDLHAELVRRADAQPDTTDQPPLDLPEQPAGDTPNAQE